MRADNYSGELANREYSNLMDMYSGQLPTQLGIDQQYQPAYTALNLQTTGQANTGLSGLYGQNVNQEVGMLGDNAGQIRQALIQSNPESARLLALLNQQAETDLMAGSGLNAQDQRYAQQNSRAALASRGMSGSNQAIADEILQQYNLGQTRLNERRNFAGNVVGLNTNTLQNPMLAYLAASQGNAQNRLGTAAAFSTGASQSLRNSPATNWISSVYDQNQQNNRATAANETQMSIAAMQEIASMAGMGAGMCWAAREVFGPDDLRWYQFRVWLLFEAPARLREWYRANGERWAARLRANPVAKAVVKRWMENRIEKGIA